MNQTPDHLLSPHKSAVIAAVRELLHASMADGAVFEIPGTSPAHVVAIGPRAAIPRLLELRAREPMAGGRRLSDALPAEPLNWHEPEPGQPRRWAALITSANHGMLAEPGHTFPAVQAKFERIEVVEVLDSAADDAELIELLRAIRPKHGAIGSRDVDVTAQQKRIDRAIQLLSSRIRVAPAPAALAPGEGKED